MKQIDEKFQEILEDAQQQYEEGVEDLRKQFQDAKAQYDRELSGVVKTVREYNDIPEDYELDMEGDPTFVLPEDDEEE